MADRRIKASEMRLFIVRQTVRQKETHRAIWRHHVDIMGENRWPNFILQGQEYEVCQEDGGRGDLRLEQAIGCLILGDKTKTKIYLKAKMDCVQYRVTCSVPSLAGCDGVP
jgi:hypothetical protein